MANLKPVLHLLDQLPEQVEYNSIQTLKQVELTPTDLVAQYSNSSAILTLKIGDRPTKPQTIIQVISFHINITFGISSLFMT